MKGILSSLLFFIVISGLAQDQPKDTTYVLDELVISANKVPELKSRIAQQVQILSETQIGDLQAQSTADLLANSGSLSVQKSQQGGGSPQIRGFEASRVVLVVDGVRMNNLIYRAGHLQNVLTVDNNSLERVEILFGPSSTVYGSDALGGVIHFKMRDPELSKDQSTIANGNTMFRYGSVNNEKTTHLDFNVAGKRFGSYTSLSISVFDDLKTGKRINPALGEAFGLRNAYVSRAADNLSDIVVDNSDPYVQKFSGYSQLDLLQKFLFSPHERVTHLLNLQFSNSSDIPRYDRLTDKEGNGFRNAAWYYGPQKRLMAAYQLSSTNRGRLADGFTTTLSYQHIEESRHVRRFNADDTQNQLETVNVMAFNINFNKDLNFHEVRYGLDAQFNHLSSNANNRNMINGAVTPSPTRYPRGDSNMTLLGLYFTHAHDITRLLTLNDGLRFGWSGLNTQFKDKSFFPFPFNEAIQRNTYASGNVGLVFRPDQLWKISFMVSTGYRVPNIDDVAKVFDTNAGESLIIPNPDIRPEKTINTDFSVTRNFSDKIRWENTLFYTFFYDAIVLDAFSFNDQTEIEYQGEITRIYANQNKRRAFITGVSSLLHANISPSLMADASFTYTYGRIREASGKIPLDHIPPSFGRVSIQYKHRKVGSEIFVNFSAWKRIDDYLLNSEDNEAYAPAVGTPPWFTLNARVTYDLSRAFALQMGVDNLLDLQYRTFSSGINAPGRNIFGTLKIRF